MDLFVYYSPLHSGSHFENKILKIITPTSLLTPLLFLGKSRVNQGKKGVSVVQGGNVGLVTQGSVVRSLVLAT